MGVRPLTRGGSESRDISGQRQQQPGAACEESKRNKHNVAPECGVEWWCGGQRRCQEEYVLEGLQF